MKIFSELKTIPQQNQNILSATLGNIIRLTDVKTGNQLQEYAGHVHKSYKLDACIASDDCHIVGGSEDGRVYHWNLLDGKMLRKSERVHSKSLSSIAYHPTSPVYITASYDGTSKCFQSQY